MSEPRQTPFKVRRNWIVLGIVFFVAIGSWPAYRWWQNHRTEQFLAECKSAVAAEDWKSLEEISRRWLAWNEDNGDAWLFLATAAQEQNDQELAVECIDRIPDDHPKCVVSLLQRIDLLMTLDRALEAEATAERVIRLEPAAGRAHTFLLYYSAMTLQRKKLLQRIRRSIQYKCEPPDAYAYLFTSSALKFQSGFVLNSKWLERYPENEQFIVARAYFRATDGVPTVFESSDNTLLMKECLKKYPGNAEVLAYHLDLAIDAGNLDEVARLLTSAPPSAAENSRIWAAKGWYFVSQNQFDEASEAYREALKVNPYDWRARYQLATVLRRLNKTEEAERAAKVAFLGKQLEKEVLTLQSTVAITLPLLEKMAVCAEAVGDQQVAAGIYRRIRPDPLGGIGMR